MSFTSIGFLVFLIPVLVIFVLVNTRYRWIVLLLASLLFYAYLQAPHLLAALAVVTLTSYLVGKWMTSAIAQRRKLIFFAGVVIDLLVLVSFRYLPVLIPAALLGISATSNPSVSPVIITIGISFFVFQGISYLSDLYLETIDAEPHLGRFALYMAFFPKILQGPIERGGDLLPQLVDGLKFDEGAASQGLRRFAWGSF